MRWGHESGFLPASWPGVRLLTRAARIEGPTANRAATPLESSLRLRSGQAEGVSTRVAGRVGGETVFRCKCSSCLLYFSLLCSFLLAVSEELIGNVKNVENDL